MTTRTIGGLFFALGLGAALAFGQATTPEKPKKKPAPRYETHADHDPDGIGKFYMGREIAQVMSYHGAGWLERPEREREERTTKLMPALKVKPGDVVADVGAGSGYHTVRLAKLVGPKGKVYAVDIQPQMLMILGKRARAMGLRNVQLVQGTVKEPKLPPGSVDLILLVDVYHEFAYPYEMTEALVKSLKPGGRLAFVEFRLEDDNVPIKLLHKMTERQVLKEMAPFPLRHAGTFGKLPWQHVIFFEKRKAAPDGKNATGP